MSSPQETEAEDASSSFEISDLPQIFADLTPVPQADGLNAVCRIDYPPHFTLAYDYFRALMQAAEVATPRALRLTQLCLSQNPANYTVWQYRRQCLAAQPNATMWTMNDELEWTATLGGDNPKNYQIWYHRRAILTRLHRQEQQQQQQHQPTTVTLFSQLGQDELDYVATVLQVDGKNYHAWTHRQWLLQTLKDNALWEAELQFVESLIAQDIRNNSAWNQRWFVTHHRGGDNSSTTTRIDRRKEMDYALQVALQDPFNESPFSYFLAMAKALRREDETVWEIEILSSYQAKLQSLWPDADDEEDDQVSPFVLSTKVEWLVYQGDDVALDKVRTLLERLAETVDPIRRKYWRFRQDQLCKPTGRA